MKSDKRLWEICMDIYRELFKEAEPSADFDELIKSGEASKQDFFMKYYLPEEKEKKIIEKHIKKNKLSKMEEHRVNKEIILGCSPTNVKEKKEK